MTAAVMSGAAAALGVVVLFVVVPRSVHRGLAATLSVGVVVLASAATAPSLLVALSPLVVTALMLTGALLGERRTIRRAVPVILVLSASAAVSVVTTAALFPQGAALFARLMVAGIATMVCVAGFDHGDRRFLVIGLITVASIEAVLGVLEFAVTHRPVPWGFKTGPTGKAVMLRNSLLPGDHVRVSGSVGHPIPYALVIATGMLCVFLEWARTGALLRIALLPLLVTALVLSSSRSVIIALGLALLYVLWTSQRQHLPVRLVLLALGGVLGAMAVGDAVSSAAGDFLASGSYENRANSLRAVPGLLTRPTLEMLFGSGFGTDASLFDRGFFVDIGVRVIDDQLVTTLATQGLVGAVLFVAMFVVAWLTASRSGRALIVLMGTMTVSFDYMAWLSMIVLLGVAFAIPDASDADDAAERRHPAARRRTVVRAGRRAVPGPPSGAGTALPGRPRPAALGHRMH